jgi:hypothetical protein
MMTDDNEKKAEVGVQRFVRLWIDEFPEQDWVAFRDIAVRYNSKEAALRACIEAYYTARELGEVHARLDALEKRIAELEDTEKEEPAKEREERAEGLKTFGGGKI